MQNDKVAFSDKSVQNHFVILAVSWWIGLPLSVIGDFMSQTVSFLIGFIWVPAIIVATVFWCILLYRQWSLLQGHGARVTPGKAVGFGFIPLYCFYWWFIAYAGLATDTNNYMKKENITANPMSFGLAVADCVLSILTCTIGLIPKIGAVLDIPLMIVGFILIMQQRDCVLAILKHRMEKLQVASSVL